VKPVSTNVHQNPRGWPLLRNQPNCDKTTRRKGSKYSHVALDVTGAGYVGPGCPTPSTDLSLGGCDGLWAMSAVK
jgi:hypothetical protein